MDGRFVFQKFSGMRSTSRLGSYVPASRAVAPVTQTAPDCSTRNISDVLHGAAPRLGMAFPNNHGIRAFATRSPCSRPAVAETSWPTTGMPSVILNRTTPTFVGSVTGSKRGLSSTASNKHEPSGKAKMAARHDPANDDVHDFTPSVILNSLATLGICLGLISLSKGN